MLHVLDFKVTACQTLYHDKAHYDI